MMVNRLFHFTNISLLLFIIIIIIIIINIIVLSGAIPVLSVIQIYVPPSSNPRPTAKKKKKKNLPPPTTQIIKQLLFSSRTDPQGKFLQGKSSRKSEQMSVLVKVAENYCDAPPPPPPPLAIMPTGRTELLAFADPKFSWLTVS